MTEDNSRNLAWNTLYNVVRQRKITQGQQKCKRLQKRASEKVLFCRYSAHALRVAGVTGRVFIRTDFGMLHGEFQHGPLGGITDNGQFFTGVKCIIRISKSLVGQLIILLLHSRPQTRLDQMKLSTIRISDVSCVYI